MKVTPQSIQKYIQEHWIGGVITLGAIIVVTLFHWFGIFDTIELNRQIDSDNQNMYTFAPFHGTPLRTVAEKMGLIDHATITKCLQDKPLLVMPEYPPEEIEGIKRCFSLYVKFPKNRWKDIEKAEKFNAEGNKIYQDLRLEHIEKYFPKSMSEDMHDMSKNSFVSDDIKKGYADEMN